MKYRASSACTLIIILAALASGCGSAPGANSSKTHDAAVCNGIAARFDRALESATGTCQTDSDCGCYNPVSLKAGCGGITDRVTAKRLKELEAEFHRAGCPWPVDCAAWMCDPVCRSGRCVNAR